MANRKTQRTSRQTRRGAAPKLTMSTRRSAGRRPAREPEFGGMTVREAGRKGGQTVRDKYGHSFYEEIGRKGGETVKAERGRSFYEQIGKKGGDTVKAERGAAFYEQIGKKGGDAVRQLIEEGKKAANEAKAMAARDDDVPAVGGEVLPAASEE